MGDCICRSPIFAFLCGGLHRVYLGVDDMTYAVCIIGGLFIAAWVLLRVGDIMVELGRIRMLLEELVERGYRN